MLARARVSLTELCRGQRTVPSRRELAMAKSLGLTFPTYFDKPPRFLVRQDVMKALNNKLKDLGVTYSHLGDQDLHRKWALLRQQTASGLPEDAPAPLNTSAKTDVAATSPKQVILMEKAAVKAKKNKNKAKSKPKPKPIDKKK